ncbi:hypothetical protein NKH77_22715 [Streptomyces sp. M19]
MFTAKHGGTTKVTARNGDAAGSTRLTVLDTLDRLVPDTRRIGIADSDGSGRFGFIGLDAHGDSAPIEPSDVTLDYDHDRFAVTPDAKGGFTVKPSGGPTASTPGDHRDGRRQEHRARRHRRAHRPEGGVLRRRGLLDVQPGPCQRLAGSHARRARGHRPGDELRLHPVDRDPRRLRHAAEGDPGGGATAVVRPVDQGRRQGAWPTLHLKDAAGTDQLLRGPYVNWTGWKHVEFDVPSGIAYPVSVNRFYLAETSAGRQYTGKITIDELTAEVPPSVDLPEQPTPRTRSSPPRRTPRAVTGGSP